MPEPAKNNVLDFKTEIERIKGMYRDSPHSKLMHALIIGDKGTGKTRLALTCPKPVLIHSFDPGGTETVHKAIDAGDIIADTRFEVDSPDNPTAYNLWEREFKNLKRLKFFDNIGTYMLDSLSVLSVCASWQILSKESRILPGMQAPADERKYGMRYQDWGTLLTTLTKVCREINTLPCHTIMTAHVSRELDALTQHFVKGVLLNGQARDQVPNLTQELFVLQTKRTSTGTARVLLTQNDGEYRATTRMGSEGVLAAEEPADIRALLKKVGYNYMDKEPMA